MSDKFRIDSHKLIYHPQRVADWFTARGDWEKAKKIYPIYVEVSPVGYCNHRCTFCALDFMEYQKRQIDPAVLAAAIDDMGKHGVKSIMFAGEGEPFLYKEMPEMVERCTAVGIDTSFTTNIVPLLDKHIETYMKNCSWIKVSFNAGTKSAYAAIHRTNERDFDRAVDNMKKCVAVKREKGYQCTLGAQMLLLPENADTAVAFARLGKEIGLDYVVIKPYSQHLASHTTQYQNIDYRKYYPLADELAQFNCETFNVIFRIRTMEKWAGSADRYTKCNSVPFFWGYIQSDGAVYGCSCHLTDERFNYGNIHEVSFSDIWEGSRRKAGYEHVRDTLDIHECRVNCRMDEINRYLWELTHPSAHVNFI